MREAVQIVLVRPRDDLHADALLEAAEYFHHQVESAGVPCRTVVNGFDPGRLNILVGAHLMGEDAWDLIPPGSVLFNSEPLELKQDPLTLRLLAQHRVWDYSARNLPLLPHQRAEVVPFLHCPRMVRPGLSWHPGGALLIYGALTPHRAAWLDRLRAEGLAVEHLFGVYGAARDAAMARALAVLNLRQQPGPQPFQPLRCQYPLIQGVPVVSEPAPDDPAAKPFLPSLFLLPEAIPLLRNHAAFLRQAQARLAAWRKTNLGPAVRKALLRALREPG